MKLTKTFILQHDFVSSTLKGWFEELLISGLDNSLCFVTPAGALCDNRFVFTEGGGAGEGVWREDLWRLSCLGRPQQINSTQFLTRPQTMVEVATRPPTLAHSLTRNWKKPSLSLVTSTLRAERSYLKYIPGVP